MRSRSISLGLLLISVGMLLAFLVAPAAQGAAPLQLWEKCDFGTAAGQCRYPGGLETDPVTGDVFVADSQNQRVNEFTVWGDFIRAFGWDVSPEGTPGDTVTDQLEAPARPSVRPERPEAALVS